MPVQKIKSGRIITVQAPTYVGEKGTIFYDEDTPELRLSDGHTPGGILFTSGSGGTGTYVLVTATNTRLGGVKIGANVSITAEGTISVAAPFSGNYNDLTNTPAPYVLNTATGSILGGVKIGANVSITADGTISVAAPFSGDYNDLTNTPTPYVLVTATNTSLGGVKVGAGLSISGDGTLSAVSTSSYVLNTATSSVLGGVKVGTGLSISGDGTLSAVSTSSYVLPAATTSTLGGIKVGSNLTIGLDGTLNANTATAGVSSTFKTIKVSSSTDLVASGEDVLEFVAGNAITITTDPAASPYKTITIEALGFGNLDGGYPNSIYGGLDPINGGGI